MSKSLEALENIKGNCDLFDEGYQWDNEFSKQFDLDIDTIEKELKRLEEIDDILNTGGGIWAENGIVSKKLKALEIIVKKGVHITLIKNCKDVETYNKMLLGTMNKTTAKKYNLLDEQFNAVKEVLL